ncbi:TonB-dependent siderophore receptor [Chlorogloeopsis sp. ULAP01]|uniref:TonB-dependent siderophore receptor n=1 Tax=Chlorogloeopsis sp. ULAP01 TaxID=3056483 RepID=UPI0025AB5365|nr:TonB-dependent siderophore receptor [Chlorogloeopsis sp. ULAP01]MDM9381150.1 TonB-dependent siderophore receptor [Chlorogloeopsis sp. ULAP01]
MKPGLLSSNFHLKLTLILSTFLSIFAVKPVWANEKFVGYQISSLSEIELPATSAQNLVQTPTPTNPPVSPLTKGGRKGGVVPITGVKANPTDKGVEIVLETILGEKLQVTNRSTGNNFIADIPGAQLRLPSGEAFTFRSEKPLEGITVITVANIDANTVRITVAGEKTLPAIELFDDDTGLIFTVAPTATTAENPTPPTAPLPLPRGGEGEGSEEPAAQQDEPIELVVTGEQDGYRVPDTSVGTRTDTPLRDIPQSIQVIPQQVLQDRQVRSITEGLENSAGITSITNAADRRAWFTVRGFENYGGFLVNGIPDPQISTLGGFVNAERLEVLRGPAAALYGEVGSLGGTINIVTRQPLSDPFYEVSATAGSFNDYQGTFDFSGPFNDSKTVFYRLIGSYRNFDTFLDFFEGSETFIAPSLAVKMSPNTDFILEGDVNIVDRPDGGLSKPIVGTILENPNGKVSRSFNPEGPVDNGKFYNGRVGYRLEHRFNEDWKLRNAFRYTFAIPDDQVNFFPDSLADDNRTLNRSVNVGRGYYNTYYLDTNLLGKFSTGSIEHQLLVGLDLTRDTTDVIYEFGDAQPVDIFDPVYDQTLSLTGQPTLDSFTTRDTLGIYLQDQVTIAQNFKLLLGGRLDFFGETSDNRLSDEETSQSETAFSPRVGIVYQPIPPISLYASYARSFVPTIGIAADGDPFRPERGTQYEVGIKTDINDKLSVNLALYDLTRSNVTTPDPYNPNFSVQTGKQRSRGVELDISGEILPGWNIIGGYAYTDARITEDNDLTIEGNQRFSAPEHTFNLWTTYRIQNGDLQGLGFGLGFYYTGERFVDNANTVELPSFFRTDAAIFYERDRFRAALNFRNIFDVESYTSGGSSSFIERGAPFNLLGTVSWQF